MSLNPKPSFLPEWVYFFELKGGLLQFSAFIKLSNSLNSNGIIIQYLWEQCRHTVNVIWVFYYQSISSSGPREGYTLSAVFQRALFSVVDKLSKVQYQNHTINTPLPFVSNLPNISVCFHLEEE